MNEFVKVLNLNRRDKIYDRILRDHRQDGNVAVVTCRMATLQLLFKEKCERTSRLSERASLSQGEGIIGCKDKTSSWYLFGFPNSSNIGSTVVVVVVVVSHIQRIGCQPEKTTLHGGQSRSWSAEQGKENKRKSLAAYPPPPPPTLLVRRK